MTKKNKKKSHTKPHAKSKNKFKEPKNVNLFKYLKNNLTRFLFGVIIAILSGIVSGAIVTFFFMSPHMALTDAKCKVSNDKIEILVTAANSGGSAAKRCFADIFYGSEKMEPENFIFHHVDSFTNLQVGDKRNIHVKNFPIMKDRAVIFLLVYYEDQSFLRQRVNQYLLRKKYFLTQLMFLEKNNIFVEAPNDYKDKYSEMFLSVADKLDNNFIVH